METLKIEAKEDTPKIVLDPATNQYEISGRSLPEDVMSFYQPVMTWLDQLAKSPIPSMIFQIKLEYFNTASSKLILDILMKLEAIHEAGSPLTIKWFYDKDDEDMQEAGEEYSELVSVNFEMVAF